MIFRRRHRLVPKSDRNLYCFFNNSKDYFDYLRMVRNVRPYIRCNFTRRELLVLWLKLIKGYGRREIRRRTGISERQIRYVFTKKEEYFGKTKITKKTVHLADGII